MPTFSLSVLFAPIITAIKPSFEVAADSVLVLCVLLTALWAYWSNVQRIIGFIRGLQIDKKNADRKKKRSSYLQYRDDRQDIEWRSAGLDPYQARLDMHRDAELRRESRSRRR